MRRMTYVLTEMGVHLWLKGAMVVMTALVIMSSIQFFQAYETYLAHTQALTKNFGSDSSIRLVDVSTDFISPKDTLAIIEEGKALFGEDIYYYLQGGDYFADADAFIFSESSMPIENQFGQPLVQPQLMIMNQALVEKAAFHLSSGHQLDDTDFAVQGNGILLGADYQEGYQIGDDFLLQTYEDVDDEGLVITVERSYTVKGFLTDNHALQNFWQGMTEEIILDKMIVMPLTEDMVQSNSPTLAVQMMGFFYMLPAEAEKKLDYLATAEAVKEIGLSHGYLSFINDRTSYDYEINMYRSLYRNQLLLLLLLLVFATVQTGMIVHFSYKKRLSAYDAYFSIGSTKTEIFMILITGYLLLFVVAWALLSILAQTFLNEEWLLRQIVVGTLSYFAIYLLIVLIVLYFHCFPRKKTGGISLGEGGNQHD
ncbi:hypothetical protein A5886_001552 [Enterococcus sp. 8G7_MSG3316]|uniref:Uncharacterized protein n=1 Tax=Candidatus Enterococcus testudinis TaxID=1834191 RepID=A0A242A612_9ENTE|nr:hypothetical protein [Enterococcus sp. 8G7_MSG3316]OTN76475.1 hypothetical protein A5886_001552 [Enterococcus sp. 8G7_MSG3316]